MRKPRDFDAELKVLDQRAKALRTKQRDHLGELVVASGAHQLPIEVLAGALLAAVRADVATKEVWNTRGAAFFRGERDDAGKSNFQHARRSSALGGDAQSSDDTQSAS